MVNSIITVKGSKPNLDANKLFYGTSQNAEKENLKIQLENQ